MKRICFLLAVLPLLALSCAKDTYVPGDPDPDGCYGVYFPEQGGYGSIMLRPTADRVITYTACRTRTDGAITVPVTVHADDAFRVDPITFADGEAKTTFSVHFDNIEEQVEFPFELLVTDPAYASQYTLNRRHITFSLLVGNRKIVPNHRTDWRFIYYSSYYYVYTGDGYYTFCTVPASDGDPDDEAYVQAVLDRFNAELEEHFSGISPTFLTDYSTAAWSLFQGQAHYCSTPGSTGGSGSGNYVAFMFGITGSPYCNGDYQYTTLTVE